MLKYLYITAFAGIFTIFTSIANAQDFDKGLAFAKNGDFAAAIKEWRPLAEQGHADAQSNLGVMYAKGDGVLKDAAEAVRWFRLAAEQGHAGAQSNLGTMYANGEGVLKDAATAHMWYNIVSANGVENAGKLRDELETKMTPEQIANAVQRARTCMSSNYAQCN